MLNSILYFSDCTVDGIDEILLKISFAQLNREFETLKVSQEFQKEYWQLRHKKSDIVCVLQFNHNDTISTEEKSAEIISKFTKLHPICKFYNILYVE